MITIVDYGMGNLRSVYNALSLLGADVQISDRPADVLTAERLILPGVGAFGLAMRNLRERGLIEPLNQKVLAEKTPLLAICLGMQLLAESSNEHGEHEGLGWLPGQVRLFDVEHFNLSVPHVGWNEITPQSESPLFRGLGANREFYFVHSYHFIADDPSIVTATAFYGYEFAAAVGRESILGTQFHPEKSQDNGLRLLQNFMTMESVQVRA